MTLTPRQQEVLDYIKKCIEEKYPPTLEEIAERFEWKSRNAADQHLRALEKKGFIKKTPGASRSIEVVQHGQVSI